MNNKTKLIIIGSLIILGFIGNLLNYFDIKTFNLLTSVANGTGRVGGIILLTHHVSLKRQDHRPYFQMILGFLCILIIGILFKFSHWPYSNFILNIGLLGFPITYIIRFGRKQHKKVLDILKVLWVTLIFIMLIFNINHWPYVHELLIVENFIFIFMIIDFVAQNFQTSKQTT